MSQLARAALDNLADALAAEVVMSADLLIRLAVRDAV